MNVRLSTDKIQLFSYFLVVSLMGSLLLSLPVAYKGGCKPDYVDALFTAVSAVCVTGLSTVSMSVYSNTGFLFIMLLIELGGLGIITIVALYVAIPQRKMSLVNRRVVREFFIDDVETNPRKILRSIVTFTLVTQLAAACVLYRPFKEAGFTRPFFASLFHAVSAFCNAGFSLQDESLFFFRSSPLVLWTMMLLIVSGGIGFIVVTDIWHVLTRKRGRLSFHSSVALTVTCILLVLGFLVPFLAEYTRALSPYSLLDKIMLSFFQSVTPRTAGFSVLPQTAWSPVTHLFSLIFMFIGGSSGSIAGGIKTTTFAIVVMYALKGNTELKGLNLGKRNINSELIERSFSIFAKSLMLVFFSVTLLVITESTALSAGVFRIFDVIYEVFSAFGTVGLSLGITGQLSFWGKTVIILTMFIARIGLVAMALGFFRNDRERFFEYPSARVIVG